jgi:hypothetical protein
MGRHFEGGKQTKAIHVSTETNKLIDKLAERESRKTGYSIKARNIVERAVLELSTRLLKK